MTALSFDRLVQSDGKFGVHNILCSFCGSENSAAGPIAVALARAAA
jgi:hypothetical protein